MASRSGHLSGALSVRRSRNFEGIGPAEYRFLIERNADGIVVVDPMGIVVFVNPAAAQVFGRAVEALLGQPIGIPVAAGETTEIVILRPDGGRADVEMRVVETTWDNRPALLASLRDISARREAEERARQSQKMEAVGRLTAGIAHDFNNLLTVVIGNLEFLQRRLANGDDRAERYADNAMQGARRAATLTQQLLAFSRRQPLSPQAVDVNQLLSGMGELLSRTLGEGVRIERELDPKAPHILADANQLEAAILNLAVNARDAMPRGGVLILRTATATFGSNAATELVGEPCVRVTVRDNGSGMTEEVLSQVFEPFFTTKDVGHGTGLGLSQVYGFVTQSGGAVRIESRPDEGAAVHLEFPPANSRPTAAVAPDAIAPAAAGIREGAILVVEDNDDVRAFSVGALRDLGYRIVEAADGASALRALDASPEVRLLFSDIGLPGGMNGRELADEVRARRPDVLILLTTAYAGGTLVKDGKLEPRIHFLPKPFTYGALASKVDQVLNAPIEPPAVLLVEDDSLVRMTIVQALLDAGCRVDEAATASEALEKIRSAQARIDAAVIDLGLPDGGGEALVAELRKRRGGVPILIASGYGDHYMRSRQPDGDGLAFLEKPFDGSKLRERLTVLGVLAS